MSARRLRAEDFAKYNLPSSPTLSPDGQSIVYALKRTHLGENRYTSQLVRITWSGGRPEPLTRGTHSDVAPAFSPSGREVAFLSDRDGSRNIWLLPATGGEPRRLTSLTGPVARFRWRPDGRALLVVHRHEPVVDAEVRKRRPTYKHITRLRRKMDGDGWLPETRHHVYVVSARTGRARQVTSGAFDVLDACFRPDGKEIAFLSNLDADADRWVDQQKIYVVPATGGRPREVTRRAGPKMFLLWHDGAIIYGGHHGTPGEWIQHDCALYEVRPSRRTERALTKPLRNWPQNLTASDTAMPVACAPAVYTRDGETRLAFSIQEEGACRVYSIPRAGGRARHEFGDAHNAMGMSLTAEGRAAIIATTMRDAGDVYATTLDGGGEARRLTEVNRTFLRRIAAPEPEETWFRNGKRRIHGWILKPRGFRRGRRYPMLLEIHGGPMAQYGYVFFHEIQLLADAGYVVVFTNPRGSSGYGTPWMRAIDAGRWGTVDHDDLMAVVSSMARRPYVNARRMGVLGGSYGGYMTTHIIGRTHRFRAAVTQRQAGNRLIHYGVSDLGWYASRFAGGARPWEKPAAYLSRSPNYRAGRIKTPLLIIHSEQDHRCPIVEGEELFTFLAEQGKTVEMVAFEGESHGLSRGGRPQNRLERLRRILDWFERYL